MKPVPSNKKIKVQPRTAGIVSNPIKNIAPKGPSFYYAIILIIILCFGLYGNTLYLKYAYDDLMVITGNQFTKQGIAGIGNILSTDFFTGFFGKDQNMVSGGRYRPLSLVTFALEYQVFGENPFIGHLVNLLIFTASCILIFILLRKLQASVKHRNAPRPWFFAPCFIITLLFLAHPVHTEVVANIKGRDELLAFLFSLLSLYFTLQYLELKKPYFSLLSGLSFFLALLSKENSLTFLLIQPLAIYFFTSHKLKQNLISLVPLVIPAFAFLMIRQAVVGSSHNFLENDLMNNPFVEMNSAQKYSTILYTLGVYIKLLFFPHPLTSDYYPYHIPIINPGDLRSLIPLAIYVLMIIYVFLNFRKKSVAVFCIIYFLVTLSLVANILFPIGAFMSERFLYMPSLGFCIAMGSGFIYLIDRYFRNSSAGKTAIACLVLLTLSLYGFKTISRNADWYDSYTLFTTDVRVSRNSAKGNELAGEYIMQKAMQMHDKAKRDSSLRRSIVYLQKAVSIYPKQIIALINLAGAYYDYNKDYDTILAVYKTILRYTPDNAQIYMFFNSIMERYDSVDHKIRLYRDLRQMNTERYDVNMNLGLLYLAGKKDASAAIPYLETALKARPGDFDGQKFLGTAYAMKQRWAEARPLLENADRINSNDRDLIQNLAVVYQNLGNNDKARQYFLRLKKGS